MNEFEWTEEERSTVANIIQMIGVVEIDLFVRPLRPTPKERDLLISAGKKMLIAGLKDRGCK